MKRPSFQFYPADWRANANLRRCSDAARGAWMDILCVLHDSDEYGAVRWPLAELARVAGVAFKLAKELADKLVLKGADSGAVTYDHRPRHAGKEGDPIRLVDGVGPIWFSSRMVTDEWRRSVSGGKTRFAPTLPDTKPPTMPRLGDDLGDGATSPSTSSSTSKKKDTSLRSVVVRTQIPEWIPSGPWAAFLEMRSKIKAPITEHGKLLLIAKLKKMRCSEDIGAVLDQSTMNSWKGVFPVKHDNLHGQGRPPSAHDKFNAGVAQFIQGLGPDAERPGEAEIGGDADGVVVPLLAPRLLA